MKIQLTQTVQKGGCAAKISASVLREVLQKLDLKTTDPNVLIDGKDFDDAGIYQVTPELALVQTLDFFTPIVDTPYLFGQIAAANALSDVYAMGGIPKTCMAILAFPLATLDPEIMADVLKGASDKIKESQSSLIGGHSIDDDTLKFGLSVTGFVDPRKMWTNKGSKPGDVLILTKGLGTGTLTAGLKNGDFSEEEIQEATQSMSTLNQTHDILTEDSKAAVHAATDVTGFGLLGHAMQMGRASGHTLKFHFSELPILGKALRSLQQENLTKAHKSNRNYTQEQTHFHTSLSPIQEEILFDPQTSGGLLMSVSPKVAPQLIQQLRMRFPFTRAIGEVIARTEKIIEIHD